MEAGQDLWTMWSLKEWAQEMPYYKFFSVWAFKREALKSFKNRVWPTLDKAGQGNGGHFSGPPNRQRFGRQVSHTLSHLEERGVLQWSNQLTLEELLNPVTERVMLSGGTSDDKIYQAVIERAEAEQNQVMDGGDGGDSIDNSAKPERPTRRDALKAALLLQIMFGRQTRLAEAQSLRPSAITDFFTSINANA
ncbi:hypothetical protein C0991_006161 [Blastosporella zonata]|nr:hypothetical protein C0991_006161 [Blastosporella zonata]